MAKKSTKTEDQVTPESLEKGDRIRKAFGYLIYKGIIKEYKDLTSIIGSNRTNISKAMNGIKAYTDGIISKLTGKFDYFSYEYLISGVGELVENVRYIDTSQNISDNYVTYKVYSEALTEIIRLKNIIDEQNNGDMNLNDETPRQENGNAGEEIAKAG